MQQQAIVNLERRKIRIRGVVQGVGFRPFVWRLAQENKLTGWILNDGSGVLLEVQGTGDAIDRFLKQLPDQLPPLAQIADWVATEVAVETDLESSRFEIRFSDSSQAKTASVPPDVAICNDCERELLDPSNRRYRYPFINCTNCGPRFTIIKELPYDRPQTTMASFELCKECLAEYQNPADRRFHAQPNACRLCGPKIWYEPNHSKLMTRSDPGQVASLPTAATPATQAPDVESVQAGCRYGEKDAWIAAARELVLNGGILAIKGIGGFHLACDAADEVAVARLRVLKQRPDKPLAVMVADLDTARQLACIDTADARLLSSPQRPIVLLPKLSENKLATSIAPGNPLIGLILPYSPLHRLLILPGEGWVMTSGNLADEPIARDNEEATARLGEVCDAFLLHNRPIETVCDDSVLRSFRSKPLPIRRSRGYCPLPIPIAGDRPDERVNNEPNGGNSQPCVLAVGGEIKTAVCLAHENQAILGQHIGDMGNLETLVALERSVKHLLQLYQAKPAAIVADMHPGYLSRTWAKRCARESRIPFLSVQHHHAHAVALMAEHGLVQESDALIACIFDGTGYGSDGAIWGGEWLITNRLSYQRFGQLDYTPLPGGDSAIDRPAKIALSQLWHFSLRWDERLPCVVDLSEIERKLLHQQLQKKVNTLNTSSMGRLFDCVASLIGVRQRVHYEGQAAIELEHLASTVIDNNSLSDANQAAYPFDWNRRTNWVLNYRPMLEAMMNDVISGTSPAAIAARFHQTIAFATSELCRRARSQTGINIVGLTGGVFQNVLLTELTSTELDRAGFRVLTHLHVPPSDGGLALGQALVGRSILAARK